MAKSLNDVRQESIRTWAQAQKQWQQEQYKYPNFVFEEKNNNNENEATSAAGASGTGSGGATGVQPSANSNTMPPNVKGYVEFDQSFFFVLNPIGPDGPDMNYVYQTYNYSTDTLSTPVDTGYNRSDWFLDEWYPSNDGYVIFIWVHDVQNATDRVVEYVSPAGVVVWSKEIADWSTIASYRIGGIEENSQSSPLYFYSFEQISGGSYDITVDYFYQGTHYTFTEHNVLNNIYYSEFINDDNDLYGSYGGQSIFRVSTFGLPSYKYYSIGPAGVIEMTDISTGNDETVYFFSPYSYYTKDLKFAYGYEGYMPDFFVVTKMLYNNSVPRFLINNFYKIYKNDKLPYWDAYSAINTRIGELETGATLSDCYIQNSITEGVHLYQEIHNGVTGSKYIFVLNVETRTIASAIIWTYGEYISMHDMLNGNVVIRGYNDFDGYDGDFEYFADLTMVMIWSDNTVETVIYGEQIRIQSGDLNKAGNIATWFTKPVTGGQVSIVKKAKGSGATSTAIPGFTQATDDPNVDLYYEWCWDINQEAPYYILYRRDSSTFVTGSSPYYNYDILGIKIDGTFNIANKLSISAEYSNTKVGNDYTYGSHYGFEKNGSMDWYTMNPVTLKLTKQLTMSNDNFSTRRPYSPSFGNEGQKMMLFDFTTNTVHLFKAEGLVASATFENINNTSFGYTYSDNIAYANENGTWYIVDTENLTVKQVYRGQNVCDGNTAVDRIYYNVCEGPGYTDLINGSITRRISGYFPDRSLYNDIFRWHNI